MEEAYSVEQLLGSGAVLPFGLQLLERIALVVIPDQAGVDKPREVKPLGPEHGRYLRHAGWFLGEMGWISRMVKVSWRSWRKDGFPIGFSVHSSDFHGATGVFLRIYTRLKQM